jgi:hypothetical protein
VARCRATWACARSFRPTGATIGFSWDEEKHRTLTVAAIAALALGGVAGTATRASHAKRVRGAGAGSFRTKTDLVSYTIGY